jgi:hypothetical protein
MKSAKHSKPLSQRRGAPAAHTGDGKIPYREVASVPAIIASAFGKLDVERRARLLGRLLGSVGPLALAVVGGGVFAKYLRNARWPEIPVSLEDAAHASSSQVHDIVRYVEQSNPHVIDGLLAALSQDGMTMTVLGASVAAITLKRLAGRRRWKAESPIKK